MKSNITSLALVALLTTERWHRRRIFSENGTTQLLFFTSDNGLSMGEHGLFGK